jgi:hypothetical protein
VNSVIIFFFAKFGFHFYLAVQMLFLSALVEINKFLPLERIYTPQVSINCPACPKAVKYTSISNTQDVFFEFCYPVVLLNQSIAYGVGGIQRFLSKSLVGLGQEFTDEATADPGLPKQFLPSESCPICA